MRRPKSTRKVLYEQIAAMARVLELTDAMNTEKYAKLESHTKIEAVKAKVSEAVANGSPVTDPAVAEKVKKAGNYFEMLKERIFRDEDAQERAAVRMAANSTRSGRSGSRRGCCLAFTDLRSSRVVKRRL